MRNIWQPKKRLTWIIVWLLAAALSGCMSSASAQKATPSAPADLVPQSGNTLPAATRATPATEIPPGDEKDNLSTATAAASLPTKQAQAPVEQSSTRTPTVPAEAAAKELDPELWKNWPVMPVVSDEMRVLYQQGLAKGNDPLAFSVLGDCQSQPDLFMGVFESDPAIASQIPEPLLETITNFTGSFDRYSPTVKDGTTEGALLWVDWNDNKEKKCKYGETPLDCELRVHKPSIVFVHVGTHWERRSQMYFNRIIDKIIEHKAVPILVTKADNRELDDRINKNYAEMAAERGLPLWNFWATVQHLPDGGMKPTSEMYLTDEALIIHREGAIRALDTVWRAVR
jgi:hypothetical protein